jgi:hypothetical protein
VKVSVPVADPVAVGVNVTLTVQLAPALMLTPQVLFEMAKGPVTPMLVNVSATL